MRITYILVFLVLSHIAVASEARQTDTLKTSAGDLTVTCIGHGSLMFAFGGKIIHVDPYSRVADYSNLPKADLILITHEHRDHLDLQAIEQIRKHTTSIVVNENGVRQVEGGDVMTNGEINSYGQISVEAVPAYNLIHKRENGQPFHVKGSGNGYVLTFSNIRVYIAGDTENIPEMKALRDIDIAFLPMNLPYTMTPEMVADAVKMFRPKILYPYHYGSTDVNRLVELLNDLEGTEIRIRKM